MAREFTVNIPEGIEIDTALTKVKNACDSFSGTPQSGTFEKSGVEGNYRIDGRRATITLTDKPWLVSWDYVQEQIEKHFK